MIRNVIFAIAATVTIAGAATTAQAGDYGHSGYGHGYSSYGYKAFHYVRKCHRVKVGHRRVYDPYTYDYYYKPVYKRRCKRVKSYY